MRSGQHEALARRIDSTDASSRQQARARSQGLIATGPCKLATTTRYSVQSTQYCVGAAPQRFLGFGFIPVRATRPNKCELTGGREGREDIVRNTSTSYLTQPSSAKSSLESK